MILHASCKYHCENSVEKKKSKRRCNEETAGTQLRQDGGLDTAATLVPSHRTRDKTRVCVSHCISSFLFPDEENLCEVGWLAIVAC